MDRRVFAPKSEAFVQAVRSLTRDTLAVVLAAGRDERLGMLTDWRAKPAMPFGGKFRIIDFALSNCRNSSIRKILILTQYKSHSLIRHIRNGWSVSTPDRDEFVSLVPAQQWLDEETWYRSSADAVYQSLDIIRSSRPRFVAIIAGDQLCQLDYGEVLLQHMKTRADITIACTRVPVAEASHYGVVEVNGLNQITGFAEMPAAAHGLADEPDKVLVSMGIYVFTLESLVEQLREDHINNNTGHNFGADIIPEMLAQGARLFAFRHRSPVPDAPPYWQDVRSIDDYYEANMALLAGTPPVDLHNPLWPLITCETQLPPARINGGAASRIEASIVSDGCRVQRSEIRRSLLSAGVTVEADCRLDEVLALPGCHIDAGARLKRVILENGCCVPPGTCIGIDRDADRQRFHCTDSGCLVVSRDALGPSACDDSGRRRLQHFD